jgi:hypothetical protein
MSKRLVMRSGEKHKQEKNAVERDMEHSQEQSSQTA